MGTAVDMRMLFGQRVKLIKLGLRLSLIAANPFARPSPEFAEPPKEPPLASNEVPHWFPLESLRGVPLTVHQLRMIKLASLERQSRQHKEAVRSAFSADSQSGPEETRFREKLT